MRKSTAELIRRAGTDLLPSIANYYGLDRERFSRYMEGQDFIAIGNVAGVLNPWKLHESARHADGTYVHVEMGGVPKMSQAMESIHDAVPHYVMKSLLYEMKVIDPTAYRVVWSVMQHPLWSREQIAEDCGVHLGTVKNCEVRSVQILNALLYVQLKWRVHEDETA